MTKNRLSTETSPYLLQHKANPVHWWAWGEDAFAAAKKENKPVLLSVGYAACHWCHVMAHESFEDKETAALMNDLFINIKVDREERPDVDMIYQRALNMMGQQGGWPLTIFLDPNGNPFWGGTYFPNEPRHGMADFKHVLRQIAEVYNKNPEAVSKNRQALLDGLGRAWSADSEEEMSPSIMFGAAELTAQHMDAEAGGMEGAPKFPNIPLMTPLWNAGIRNNNNNYKLLFDKTLTMLCQGGIYDHLGGGFCRYSVDAYWLVPHFEKMLYDNALILEALSEVYKETRSPLYEARIRETISWLDREMKMDGGAYAASLDADSEGEEGKFYIWSQDEIEKALGNEAHNFMDYYGVSHEGNFEGRNILHRLLSGGKFDPKADANFSEAREKLLYVRAGRPRPFLDDKILADWNGLLIGALTKAALVFKNDAWLSSAKVAFKFITKTLQKKGALHHSWRNKKLGPAAFLDDYATMARAGAALYSATGDALYLKAAVAWVDEAFKILGDEDGSFFLSPPQKPRLIARPKTIHDQATPAGNGVMIEVLNALYHFTGKEVYRTGADKLIGAFAKAARTSPLASGSYFSGYDAVRFGGHLVVKGKRGSKPVEGFLEVLNSFSFPGLVVQVEDKASHLAEAKGMKDGQALFCQGTTCSLPIDKPADLEKLLKEARSFKES